MYTENIDKTDPLIKKAIEVVVENQKVSATLIQRLLKTGYARSAMLLDQMEELGIVGPANGANPRDILVKKEELDWNGLDKIMGRANQRRLIVQTKHIAVRLFRIGCVGVVLYILKLALGFDVMLVVAMAVIIEYLLSARSFYNIF